METGKEEKVKYCGEVGTYNPNLGIVWSSDNEYFAVVEKCPVCGELCGTGMGYRAEEAIYEIAYEFARKELIDHEKTNHPEWFYEE